jgi:hypothetical protein
MTATLEPSFAKAATPFPQTGASISYNGRNNAQNCLEQEIDPAKHSFRTNKVLGHGASAWVEEVVDEVEGHIMAMKVFPAHRRDRERVKARVQEEVDILREDHKQLPHCRVPACFHGSARLLHSRYTRGRLRLGYILRALHYEGICGVNSPTGQEMVLLSCSWTRIHSFAPYTS